MKRITTIIITLIIITAIAGTVIASTETVNTQIDLNEINKVELTDSATVYILPLLNSTKIGTVEKGNKVLLISVNGKWAYIQNDTKSGWIFASKLASTTITVDTSNSNGENNNSNASNTNSSIEQDNNTTDDSKLEQENITTENSDLEQNNETTTEKNVVASNNNTTGESNKTKITYPITMYVNVDAVYIRSSASKTSSSVTSIGKNTPVRVTGKEGDWYKVEVSDGKGYIMSQFLSVNKQ